MSEHALRSQSDACNTASWRVPWARALTWWETKTKRKSLCFSETGRRESSRHARDAATRDQSSSPGLTHAGGQTSRKRDDGRRAQNKDGEETFHQFLSLSVGYDVSHLWYIYPSERSHCVFLDLTPLTGANGEEVFLFLTKWRLRKILTLRPLKRQETEKGSDPKTSSASDPNSDV